MKTYLFVIVVYVLLAAVNLFTIWSSAFRPRPGIPTLVCALVAITALPALEITFAGTIMGLIRCIVDVN